ncbi:hypothetical protein BGZ65_004107 [Modicella reniformis]|uniref:Ceramide glucosyltransferase n=1 Tax=Modicella reniformis TaxID=1440133 RepID=A0A9P6M935_9FUNG|nr:hypothetical protein BGZ65_004107 [Modicella reniformis]
MDQLHNHFGFAFSQTAGFTAVSSPELPIWDRYSNLQLIGMFLSIFVWVFCLTAALAAIAISRSRYSGLKGSVSARMNKADAPGVSIIRPLRGVDCNMYENLTSSFQQDYPRFEIIFSVAQPNDPAIAVVRDLMKKFPEVDARIIIGEKNVGINPKINNMIQSYETAKYDIVWVCDSNVYVDSGCMGRSVDKMMEPGVGLVHHLPFGVRPQTLGSELELMFMDTVHAKMYLFINWTGLASCVVGKSNLYRRSDLDKVGGLAAFGKYMAEDNLSLGSMTPSDYFLRRARWTRIRKYTVTAATIVEPFIEMIGCGLVASYGFNLLWNIHALNFLAFHVVMWFLTDLTLFQALSGEKMDNLRGFLMAWCLRELVALPMYTYAVAGSTVDWRDQSFFLLRDGTVKPVSSAPVVSKASKSSRSNSTSSSSSSSAGSSMNNWSVPPSPTTAAFWANTMETMVSQSTQASLRKFFRHPAVISIVRSTFAVIHFAVDILIKSQRNGYQEEDEDELLDGHLASENVHVTTEKDEILKLQKVPHLRRKLNHKRYGLDYDGDDSSAYESDIVLRRSVRLKTPGAAGTTKSSQQQQQKHQSPSYESENDDEYVVPLSKYSNTKSETEAEHGRRSTEEDELSKAVEPYLSDSLSRRSRIRRREIPATTQFLSVTS